MMKMLGWLAACAAVAAAPAMAQTTLAQSNATTTDYGASFIGQSFTVGAAGTRYNNIQFSWLTIGNTGTLAPGNLYLFASPYAGAPNSLASAGALGVATGSNGTYSFSSTLRLTGGSMYYAYTDTFFNPGGDSANPYTGGTAYFADNASQAYYEAVGFDNAFRVAGVAAAVPEPGSWLMMIVGFGVIAGNLRRRRYRGAPVAV